MSKIVRTVVLALLASLLTGLVIGTLIRLRLERPEPGYFIGARVGGNEAEVPPASPGSGSRPG